MEILHHLPLMISLRLKYWHLVDSRLLSIQKIHIECISESQSPLQYIRPGIAQVH